METEGKGLKILHATRIEEGTCNTPGCDHTTRTNLSPEPGQSAGPLCGCCRRRTLERRLSDLQVEISLLPGQIKSLPRHCLHEVRPDYENIWT
jgi:hypothetical protein